MVARRARRARDAEPRRPRDRRHSLGSSTTKPHDVSWAAQGPYDQPRTALPLSGVPVTSTYLPRQPWTVETTTLSGDEPGPPKLATAAASQRGAVRRVTATSVVPTSRPDTQPRPS